MTKYEEHMAEIAESADLVEFKRYGIEMAMFIDYSIYRR